MSVCVLGSINLDVVAKVEHLPRPGETISALNLKHFPGGKGANQAVASAHMGASTLMLGAVGADDPGEKMRAYLKQSGVNTSFIKINAKQPTGQAFINVSNNGENSIVIVPGANGAFLPDDITDDSLVKSRIFLAQLETPVETIKTLFSSDRAREGITILNAAPALANGADIFPLVDILIVNEIELATYAALPEIVESLDEISNAARKLISNDKQHVLVTLGAQGVAVIDSTQGEIVPGIPAQVVDTTGAGDCFCGVLAAGLAENLALADATKLAVTAASLSVRRSGAATSIPSRDEVESILVRH